MDEIITLSRSVLQTTPQRWLALCEELPAELLRRAPVPGEWTAHDLMHTVQAERALMQPFIDDCGPWQPYFADHWIGGPKGENQS